MSLSTTVLELKFIDPHMNDLILKLPYLILILHALEYWYVLRINFEFTSFFNCLDFPQDPSIDKLLIFTAVRPNPFFL